MVRVYVHSKKQCPTDAVLREGPHGGKYYVPNERGKGAEVGGVTDSFDELFSSLEKERVYVDNPASVPPELEPKKGQYGGWYYERPDPEEESIIEELIQMIGDQILPDMELGQMGQEEFPSRVREEVQDRIQLSSVEKSEFINEVKDIMSKEDSEKLQMERVYVGTEDEVPEPYEAQTDENGDMFYEVDDGVHIESGRETTPIKSIDKDYELEEGLTWTEEVMVTDIDEESGMVTMVDTEGASEWQEDMDGVEAKLEALEAADHDWMYEFIAGEYASLDEEEVHEVLHEAAGIDKGVRLDYESRLNKEEDPCWDGYTMVGTKENGDPRCVPNDDVENYDADKSTDFEDSLFGFEVGKSRVYVDSPDEVPEGYDAQEGEGGGVYYETGTQSSDLDDMDDDELGQLREYLMDRHSDAQDQGNDEMMRDILDTVMEVDERLAEE